MRSCRECALREKCPLAGGMLMRGDLRCNAWYPAGCLKVWMERRVKKAR